MTVEELILLLVALAGSGLFSGLETGVVSVNPIRMQHLLRRNQRGATTVQWFMDRPDHLLGTTLAGTNLCNVVVSVTGAQVAARYAGTTGLWLASLITTLLLLIFGEYLPKAWFRSFPAYRVLPWAVFLRYAGYLFYPVSMAVMQVARWLLPVPVNEAEQRNPFVTREELAYLTREGEKIGAFSREERQRMDRVLGLSRKTPADLMVPRNEMLTVQPDLSTDDALALARKRGVSRLPIYDERSSQFTGVVHIMDILVAGEAAPRAVHAFARPPQYVRVDSHIDQVLIRMRLNRQPLALVRDQRNEVIGLLSTEDILKEIVGDF